MNNYLTTVVCSLGFFILAANANLLQQNEDVNIPVKINNEESPDTPEFWVSENESTDSRSDLTDKGSNLQENTLEILNEATESVPVTENPGNETKEVAVLNSTEKNTTEAKLRCVLKVLEDGEEPRIHLLNSTALLKALTPVPNITSGECALVLFYSPWCPFSAKAAPHFNALPRLFPYFSFYALDAVSYNALNMRYGLVALPSVLLFHNGKGIVKFNESEPVLDKLVSFIQKYTGTAPLGTVKVHEENYLGPIPSVALEKTDYLLILSWVFTVSCASGWFMKSSLFQRIVESVRNAWREAEAQHEHTE